MISFSVFTLFIKIMKTRIYKKKETYFSLNNVYILFVNINKHRILTCDEVGQVFWLVRSLHKIRKLRSVPLSISVCLSVFVLMSLLFSIHIYLYLYVFIYTHAYIHTYVWVHIHTYVYVHLFCDITEIWYLNNAVHLVIFINNIW